MVSRYIFLNVVEANDTGIYFWQVLLSIFFRFYYYEFCDIKSYIQAVGSSGINAEGPRDVELDMHSSPSPIRFYSLKKNIHVFLITPFHGF